MEMMWIKIALIAGAFLVVFGVFLVRRKKKAKIYVLKKRTDLSERLKNERISAENMKSGNGTLRILGNLEEEFGRFKRLSSQRDADWVVEREEIDAFESKLKNAVAGMHAANQRGK